MQCALPKTQIENRPCTRALPKIAIQAIITRKRLTPMSALFLTKNILLLIFSYLTIAKAGGLDGLYFPF